MKLLTYSILGWLKILKIKVENVGKTSPLMQHEEEEAQARVNGWTGLGEKEAHIYALAF